MSDEATPRESSRWPAVAALIAVAFALRLVFATGLIASDDLGYARYAREIAEGVYAPDAHHFALRYGLLLPVAALYRIFGVAEWTSVVIPLVASSISVGLLALITWRLFGKTAALAAGTLYATFPLSVFYATILVPEPVAELYVLSAILLYLHAGASGRAALAVAAGACVGLGYLTKEPALFVIVALGLDALWQRQWRLAVGLAVGCAAIIALEHAYYLQATGDLLFRPHSMRAHEQHADVLETNQQLTYRLFKAYPHLMIVPNRSFGLHSVVGLAAAGLALVFVGFKRLRLPLLWAAIPWLYINFGSSNLREYVALPAAPRYIEFTYPPLFVACGALVARWAAAGRKSAWTAEIAVTLLCLTGVGCLLEDQGQPRYYAHVAAAYRPIVEQARAHNISTIYFEDNVPPRHRQTLAILAADLRETADRAAAELVLGVDRAGQPIVVTDETAAR